MKLGSFELLDFPLAWRRVRSWSRSSIMDIPDRLPYEVLDRLYGDEGPSFREEHVPHETQLVVSSKQAGTIRPFVRMHPRDIIVFQALVDRLAPTIEGALPPPNRVGAYRQILDEGSDDPFRASPRNDEFRAGISNEIALREKAYVLQTDISGYFLGVDVDRLERQLREASELPDVASDLGNLLAEFQHRGVRGLPQGIRASSPLANFYLASLDRTLGARAVPFFRWSDDMWVIADSYAEARRIQDVIERELYAIGLTLNGEKTTIMRAATAMARLEPAKKRFEAKKDEVIEDLTVEETWDEYVDLVELPDPEEVEVELVARELERLHKALADTDLPKDFHADMRQTLRSLEAVKDDAALRLIPEFIRRAPDLIDQALRYAVGVKSDSSGGAADVVMSILGGEHPARDHERLVACHRALAIAAPNPDLALCLGEVAVSDKHPLVRAKALLGWGKHSAKGDFGVVDAFLAAAEPQWRMYAFVSIQAKTKAKRAARYEAWGGNGGELLAIANAIDASKFKWTKL